MKYGQGFVKDFTTKQLTKEDEATERHAAYNSLYQLLHNEPEDKSFWFISEEDKEAFKHVMESEDFVEHLMASGNMRFQSIVYWFLSNIYWNHPEEDRNGSFGMNILALSRTVCNDYEKFIEIESDHPINYRAESEVIHNDYPDEE